MKAILLRRFLRSRAIHRPRRRSRVACLATGLRLMGVVLALSAAHVEPAHAYLDPGTGSIILQGLIAAIAAAAAMGRLYWHRIKSFFSSKRPAEPPGGPDSER